MFIEQIGARPSEEEMLRIMRPSRGGRDSQGPLDPALLTTDPALLTALLT